MSISKKYLKSKPLCKVTFKLSKEDIPGIKRVVLVGDFNNWDRSHAIELKKTKKAFTSSVNLEAGRTHEFRYILNDRHWYNDPEPDGFTPSPYMGSLNCYVQLDEVKVEKKKTSTKASKSKSKKKKLATYKMPARKAAPKRASTRKAKKKDDLKKVKGIGPKIESILNGKGILSFDDLAAADISIIQQLLDEAGARYRMHKPDLWKAEAKRLAQAIL